MELSEKIEFRNGIELANIAIAQNLIILGDYDKAIEVLNKAANIAKNRYTWFMWRIKMVLGAAYLGKGDYESALKIYIEVEEIQQKLNNNSSINPSAAYNGLGIVYFRLGRFAKDSLKANQLFMASLTSHKKCLKIAEKRLDSLEISVAYANIGQVYAFSGKYDDAIKNYQLALMISKKINYIPGIAYSHDNIGDLYEKQGKYQEALLNNFEALKIKEKHNIGNIGISYLNIGTTYQKLENETLAIEYLEKALRNNIHIKSKDRIMLTTQSLHRLYNNIGSENPLDSINAYKKAYDYLLMHSTYKDSILNEKTNKKIEELKIQYETEKKDLLLKLQQDELKNKSYQIYGLALLLLLITLISYLIYNRRMIKKEKAKIVLEQKLFRAQMNPHFIANALSAIQASVYQKPPELIANYISKFAGLMSLILEGSKEEFIPLDEDITALKSYIELQKLRFSEGFDCLLTVDDNIDCEMIMIPPMLIQPFVENAIEYGINSIDGSGFVKILYQKQNDYLIIEISDNGTDNNKNRPVEKVHKSSATAITKARFKNLNKERKKQFSIEIDHLSENGQARTLVLIQIPLS